MSFYKENPDPTDQALYQRLADILGVAAKDALDKLCEAVWDDGYDSGYDNGYEAGREAARDAAENS